MLSCWCFSTNDGLLMEESMSMMMVLFDSVEGFIAGFLLCNVRHRNRAKKSEETEQWVSEGVLYLLFMKKNRKEKRQ